MFDRKFIKCFRNMYSFDMTKKSRKKNIVMHEIPFVFIPIKIF